MLTKSGKSGRPCIVPDLRGNAVRFSKLSMMLSIGLLYICFIMVCSIYRLPRFYDFKVLVVKNLPAIAGEVRDMDSTPGSGRSTGGERGNPLRCPCLENPTDRGAWCTMLRRVAQSRT